MPTPEQVEAVARAIRAKDMSGWKTYGELAEVAAIAYESTRPAVSDEGVEEAIYEAVAMYSEEQDRELTWEEVKDTSTFWKVDGAFSARFVRTLARAVRERLEGVE